MIPLSLLLLVGCGEKSEKQEILEQPSQFEFEYGVSQLDSHYGIQLDINNISALSESDQKEIQLFSFDMCSNAKALYLETIENYQREKSPNMGKTPREYADANFDCEAIKTIEDASSEAKQVRSIDSQFVASTGFMWHFDDTEVSIKRHDGFKIDLNSKESIEAAMAYLLWYTDYFQNKNYLYTYPGLINRYNAALDEYIRLRLIRDSL